MSFPFNEDLLSNGIVFKAAYSLITGKGKKHTEEAYLHRITAPWLASCSAVLSYYLAALVVYGMFYTLS